ATPEQLEPSELIGQVRQTLEAIAPRNIRRVNINSRIVREQQLLWLDEISRDPENQLLWSQEITLNKANLLRHLLNEWHQNTAPQKTNLPTRTRGQQREQRQFWRGLVGGAGASILLLLGGWAFYSWHAAKPTTVASPSSSQVATTPTQTALDTSGVKPTPKPQDSFLIAVRIAEQASQEGSTAQSPAQWLELAARWQRASDLMANVPSGDDRYVTAQDRVVAYRKNKEMALMKANEQPVETPADLTAAPVPQ
ncbi:MAG TPA: hypothetical protein V6D34_06680, partial [Candidatus Sericytochromatia bacterium]